MWLNEVKDQIRDTDFFVSLTGWCIDEYFAQTNARCLEMLGIPKSQFIILFNSVKEKQISEKYGLTGELVNNNCWLDYDMFSISKSVNKKYDALYVARPTEWKRHHLAKGIKKLALAAGGNNHGNISIELPECINDADKKLNRSELNELINKSRCGLVLSSNEGACYASSEYLLCGVPVVSTQSTGGRDYWYDDNNSIICEPTENSVKESVDKIISMDWSADSIRDNHIIKMLSDRQKFIDNILGNLISLTDTPDIDANEYFSANYSDKLKHSNRIEYVREIFDSNTTTVNVRESHHYDFIEIGTCNFNTLLEKAAPGSLGISVEPVKQYLDQLPEHDTVIKVNAAVTHEKNQPTASVVYVPEEDIDRLEPTRGWLKGCNCINDIHPLIKKYNLSDHTVKDVVPLLNFQDLIQKYQINSVDTIKIDTEGHDHIIMKGVILYIKSLKTGLKPKYIRFEHHPLFVNDNDILYIIMEMINEGYKVHKENNDIVFNLL